MAPQFSRLERLPVTQEVVGSNPIGVAIALVEGLVVLNPHMQYWCLTDSIPAFQAGGTGSSPVYCSTKCDVRNEEGRKHTGVSSTFPLDFMEHQLSW